MSKKIALFLIVVVGLIGIVIWQTGGLSDSPEARFARAVKLMEGLQSRAIPVALSDSEIDLLEGVYQDSLVRLPNVKNFRDNDKKNLISLLSNSAFSGTGPNGLNTTGERVISMATGRVDEFKSYLSAQFESDIGITATKPEIKRLAQSINTLTNDIRLTTLFISWYENIRGTLCTTNDPENDIYISGELRFRYNNERLSLPDVCGGDNTQLKQHKCILGQYKDEESYIVRTSCPLGCRDGACLKQNQSGLIVNFPEIVTVGKNTPIKVSVLDQNGQVDMNYTGVFFIIVGGDDEAVFPTGALNIMSGEAGRMNAIKFSKEGAMTVTVRTTTGWEITKNVEVKKDEGNNRPYIQTDYPNKNESFKAGDKVKIRWSTRNITSNEMVKIELGYKHHDKTYTAGTYFEELIVEKTPNNGSFIWEIPEYYSAGAVSDSFKIKVSALSAVDYSDGNINITQDTVGGNLTVTSPKKDSGFYNGDALPIKWSKKENSSGLSLLKKSDPTFLKLFFPTGGSQGDSSWKIPTEIPQGSDYYIRVTEGASRKYTGYSGTFSIKPKTEPVICPQLSPPPADFCPNGEIVDGGKNANGCQLPPTCVNPTCPQLSPPPPGFCANGKIIDGGKNANGCQMPPICEECTNLTVSSASLNGGGTITYSCSGSNVTSYSVVLKQPNGLTINTSSSPVGSLTIPSTGVIGNYTLECFINGQNTTSSICKKSINNQAAISNTTVSCTGNLPANAIILSGPGTTARNWTYDGSPTSPYQNCSFKCPINYLYTNSTCTPVQLNSGTASTVINTNTTTLIGPSTLSNPLTTNNTTITPTYITGPVTVEGVKDCWFGDTTRRITLSEFLGYQTTSGSGIRYLDEIFLYGANAPANISAVTNILSYEETEWVNPTGEPISSSTQLTNFFMFRTNSESNRTWNIPSSGVKFYGCFARGSGPSLW